MEFFVFLIIEHYMVEDGYCCVVCVWWQDVFVVRVVFLYGIISYGVWYVSSSVFFVVVGVEVYFIDWCGFGLNVVARGDVD